MKILWIVNGPLPEASRLLGDDPSPFGGWLIHLSDYLSNLNSINMVISFPYAKNKSLEIIQGSKISYYLFPSPSAKKNCTNSIFRKILEEVEPDVVHIFGTEYSHTFEIIKICEEIDIKFVISIQGLVSIIAKHYESNLPNNVQRRFTIRDFLKMDNIKLQKKKFENNGILEIESIKRAHHIIGRTTWDRACISQINPNIRYYSNNENLRDEFYNNTWNLDYCEKHSIFTSQASYPIKGLHYLIEAMDIVIRKFPDAKLYIAGHNILKTKFKRTSYANYIAELIEKNNLDKHIIFTGLLNEKEICARYMKSNIFVLPSTIENSPNSLGEAMILGVPCVAAYVGGVPDLLTHKKEGFLYQHDAPYMMADYICELFRNKDLARKISFNARERALKTHNRERNARQLVEIYNKILDDSY